MSEWTEGVCGDGAAILRDGQPVAIADLLSHLNQPDHATALREALEAAIRFMEDRDPFGESTATTYAINRARAVLRDTSKKDRQPACPTCGGSGNILVYVGGDPDVDECPACAEREYREREMEQLDHDGQL